MTAPLDYDRQIAIMDAVCHDSRQCFAAIAEALTRPSVRWQPRVFPDGNKWCALYGLDMQMGVAGFGDTPAEAMADFDKNWLAQPAFKPTNRCPRCDQEIEPDCEPDGCRDPVCPMIGPR